MSVKAITVVVAPAAVVELALDWQHFGLVGRSYWLVDSTLEGLTYWDHVAVTPVRVAGGDGDIEELRLSDALAWQDQIDQLRVVWVRSPDAGEDTVKSMALLRDAVLKAMPQTLSERWFVDLIVPRDVRDLDVPAVVQEWQRFVLSPEDRPSPVSADTVYESSTASGQALHAALILGGVLGGSIKDLRELGQHRLTEAWMVHPFSRVVAGGARAKSAAERFLRDDVPRLTAANVKPARFVVPEDEDAERLVERVVEWVRDLGDGALRFVPPTVRQEKPEWWRQFMQFLREVGRFIKWAIIAMYGPRAIVHWIRTIWAKFQRQFETRDLGAVLGDDPGAYRFGLEDWQAREQEAAAAAVDAVELAKQEDGAIAPEPTWTAVSRLPLALIDGSEVPPGWVAPELHRRQLVLPPTQVFRFEATVEDARDLAPSAEGTTFARAFRLIRRIGRAELSAAVGIARTTLESGGIAYEGVVQRLSSRTANRLAAAVAGEDAAARMRSAAELETLEQELGPADAAPVLPRLRARVVADLLVAHATAARLATPPVLPAETAVPDIEPVIRRAAAEIAGVVLGLGLVVGLIVRFWTELDQVIAAFVPFIGGSAGVLWILVAAGAAAVLVRFLELFRHYRAYNEVGRRRVELIHRRGEAAVAATRELNKLGNGERILGRWEETLSALLGPPIDHEEDTVRPPADIPDSLRLAEPSYTDEEIQELTATRGIALGWCANARDELFERAIPRDRRTALYTDDGLSGGLLERLSDEARGGEVIGAVWSRWIRDRVDQVMAEIGKADTDVAYSGRDGLHRKLPIRAFAAEIDRLEDYEPGRAFERHLAGDDRSVPFLAQGGGTERGIDVQHLLAYVAAGLSLRSFKDRPGQRRVEVPKPGESSTSEWGR